MLKKRKTNTHKTKQDEILYNQTCLQNVYYNYINGEFIISVENEGEIEWNIERLDRITCLSEKGGWLYRRLTFNNLV